MNILSVLFTVTLIFCTIHPLHVSVTEIEMDEKDKRLEIMMRVFVSDMELIMQKNLHQPELDILKPETNADLLMRDYLKNHFFVSLDNRVQKINYIGHELDGDAFIVYIEVANVKKWKTIQVTNDILMELYDDQSNLVNVTVSGNVKSMRLTASAHGDKLSF